MVNKTKQRLEKHGLKIESPLADAGYSSGENYYFLEQQNITAYIPLLGGALSGSEGFRNDEEKDHYICPNNKILKGSGRIVDDGRGHPVRKYFSLKSDCDVCPLRSQCISANAKTKKDSTVIISFIRSRKTKSAKHKRQTHEAKTKLWQ